MLSKKYLNLDKHFPHLRAEYRFSTLSKARVEKNPAEQFARWFEAAIRAKVERPNAMILVTRSRKGIPAGRVMLLKAFSEAGFVFYTNYESPKGKEMKTNKKASLTFYWPKVERQIRIEGRVRKLPIAQSKEYFFSRARGSQIGAWLSGQSKVIANRKKLEAEFLKLQKKFEHRPIPYPKFWGGYCLEPSQYEFWQGRKNRLNDRIQYRKTTTKRWVIERLKP